ncbi:uncharacterized protein [Leptinotarsa decemlineata]|uniref:uncharacterized protein n=1 Tax=Leptinotarsa decemlineata TaxID=7539 RepID=UPI003D305F72
MARWILLVATLTLLEVQTNFEAKQICKFHLSVLQGQQMTCSNANSNFFHNFDIPLNRTHWVKCSNCTLDVLDESTFTFPKRNNIKILDLSGASIKVLRKFAFRKFLLLKFLNLHNNSIQTVESMCFDGIKMLTQLDLSRNYLKILMNNLFLGLENLDILSLNHNKVVFINSEAFNGLNNLKYLYLSHNSLSKLEENIFKPLKNLKILYLENNKIASIHPKAFTDLRSLSFLYMNNNSINYLVQYNFKSLASLVDLQLRYNNLTEIQTSSFNGLGSLKSLHLSNNNLVQIKPYGLIGLDSLEILDLVSNKFEYVNYFNYFSHIPNLRYLWLNRNEIRNLTVTFKYEVQNSLTVLDLSNNNLSSFSFRTLHENLPGVKEIFTYGNPWKCEFFAEMEKYFQKVNVSVCNSINCNADSAQEFLRNSCGRTTEVTESDINYLSTDFSTDCTEQIKSSIFLVGLVSVTIFFCH